MPDSTAGWEVIARRLVADRWPYARVYDHDLLLPGGRIIANWLHVELPAFVIVCAYIEEGAGAGQLAFVRQYRRATNSEILEFPAGHIDEGESAQAAAIRELREEGGIEARTWQFLGKFVMDANRECGWCYAYLARGARLAVAPDPGDLGDMSLHLLTPDEVHDMWRAGSFASAPTALVIGLALDALNGR